MLHDAPLEAGVVRYLLTHGYAARRCMELRPEDLTNIDRSRILHAIQQIATSGDQVTADGVIAIMVRGGHSSAPQDVRKLIADSKRLEGIEGVVPPLRDLASRRRLREPLLRLAARSEDGDISEVRAALRARRSARSACSRACRNSGDSTNRLLLMPLSVSTCSRAARWTAPPGTS